MQQSSELSEWLPAYSLPLPYCKGLSILQTNNTGQVTTHILGWALAQMLKLKQAAADSYSQYQNLNTSFYYMRAQLTYCTMLNAAACATTHGTLTLTPTPTCFHSNTFCQSTPQECLLSLMLHIRVPGQSSALQSWASWLDTAVRNITMEVMKGQSGSHFIAADVGHLKGLRQLGMSAVTHAARDTSLAEAVPWLKQCLG